MHRLPAYRVLMLIAFVLILTLPCSLWAAPIGLVPNTTNMFRDFRGVNNVGLGSGDVVQYGADIQGGSAGSTIGLLSATGAVLDAAVVCSPLAVNANFCANTLPFNTSLLSSTTTIQFGNGPDLLNVAAPSLAGANPTIPFPVSVTISAGATPQTPIFSWRIPAGFTPDAYRLNIFDVSGPNLPNGTKDVIHSVAIPSSSTSYTIPTTLTSGRTLTLGNNYAINFQVIDLRSGVTESQFVSSNSNALILNRSNSFFAFQPVAAGTAVPNVHLPQIGVDLDPNDIFGPVYQFSIARVGPSSITFIDPQVAIGYDYAIGVGDPNFASVLLPNIGDGIFDVIVGTLHNTVLAGQQFFFSEGGVSAFSVRGIEVSAGLDPANVLAFVTGLTFVSDGSFTGTMTPIVQEVAAAVPNPAPIALLTAVFVLGLLRVRRERRAS